MEHFTYPREFAVQSWPTKVERICPKLGGRAVPGGQVERPQAPSPPSPDHLQTPVSAPGTCGNPGDSSAATADSGGPAPPGVRLPASMPPPTMTSRWPQTHRCFSEPRSAQLGNGILVPTPFAIGSVSETHRCLQQPTVDTGLLGAHDPLSLPSPPSAVPGPPGLAWKTLSRTLAHTASFRARPL